MTLKICPKCKKEKDLKLFEHRKYAKDGRSDCCIQCITEHLIEYWKSLREKPTPALDLSKRTNKTKEELRKIRNEYQKQKKKTDINYKIAGAIRSRIYSQVKSLGHGKVDSTVKLLGCTIPELRKYLESQFKKGMTWANYGQGWHIDHIKPCAKFELHRAEEQYKCFHYTNLQPLWAKENYSKGSKY